jgi:hypothetical protein
MTTDPFSGPASASGVKVTEFEGRLLLVTPTNYEEGIETQYGAKDAVRASVVVIDEEDPAKSEKHDDVLMFQGRLIGQTKPFVGKGLVLGRLGKGEAKKGQSAPWMLEDPTDDDKVKGRAYLASVAPSL